MRLSAASRAVSIRIGTLEVPRNDLAKSKPFSPGIITSRMSRSKLKPLSLARASAAVSPVRKRDSRSRMRRSSSTTSKCGASSESVAGELINSSLATLSPWFGGALSARDQTQHVLAIISVDHGGEKAPCRLVRVGPEFGESAGDALRLQAGELERQRFAFWRDVQEALTPVLRAFLLNHVALIDQLLEHAAERLFGDVEDFQQVSDLHAGIAVDEMQHTVMGAAEGELAQHLVRIADEIAVSEEQQLDDVPGRL